MSGTTALSQTSVLTFPTLTATTTQGICLLTISSSVVKDSHSTRGLVKRSTSPTVRKVVCKASTRVDAPLLEVSKFAGSSSAQTRTTRANWVTSLTGAGGVWAKSSGRRCLGSEGVGTNLPRAQGLASVGAFSMAEEAKLPVVSVDWLHRHLNDPNLKVLDASWYMPFDNRDPLQEYKDCHIQGAVFFDIDAIGDITSEMPHMLPSEAAFSAAASALGLHNQDSVVVYDGKGIFSAARVWWMFRALGHEKVWVLDGGLPQWLQKKYPVESATPTALGKVVAASEAIKKIYGGEQVLFGDFKAHLQQNLVWSLDEVERNIAEKKYLLVDARSKARFDGSAPEPRQGVRGGHVPGSTCVPFTEVLTSSGTLLPLEELVGKFLHSGVSLDQPIAVSCGTGVTACILALALHRLGRTDIPVYDGSWTEWGLAPNVPVETSV